MDATMNTGRRADPVYSVPPGRHEHAERLSRLQNLADLMDSRFTIPGTDYRVGLDFLIGLIPGIGDTVTTLVSAYIIKEAHHMGAPFGLKMRMGWNIFLDWIVGFIPLIGDLFDAGFKANRRNLRLLERHLARKINPSA